MPPVDEEDALSASDLSSMGSLENTPAYLCLNEELDYISSTRHWTSDSYAAWTCAELPIEEIAAIVNKVRRILGFQFHSSLNVFELLMSQLDSRASRSDPITALRSLHADYIAGHHANYRKWYFASQMDLKDLATPENKYANGSLNDAFAQWREKYTKQSDRESLTELVVYLLCWSEAGQVRYMPECLAFIYKCARDFYAKVDELNLNLSCAPDHYLDAVISPIYNCYIRHNFTDGELRKEQGHSKVVGYDDINQLFWHYSSLKQLRINKVPIVSMPAQERYLELGKVDWDAAVSKTFYEYRTWLHSVTNFSRIFILHASAFWYYTSFNSPAIYTWEYSYRKGANPMPHIQWTTAALGGLIGPLVSVAALCGEAMFVPRKSPDSLAVLPRIAVSLLVAATILAPSIYIFVATPWGDPSVAATIVAGFQFAFAILSTLYYSTQPLASLLGIPSDNSRGRLARLYFTRSFQKLKPFDSYLSWGMSALILAAKLTESYFFLTLSVRDLVTELYTLRLSENCVGDVYLGSIICRAFPKVILATVYMLEFALFFLDTYLWYVIINTLVSILVSLQLGASIWTPWRNIYSRLPKRIASKILVEENWLSIKIIWNAVIQNMVLSHLISRDHAGDLMYKKKWDPQLRSYIATEPVFFTAEEDGSNALPNKETRRRISFFAQSLAQPIPEPISVERMPSFTVLVPHYSEKIFLTLKESIRHDDSQGKVTILEYLQKLYPSEWQHFVEDSKSCAKYYRNLSENTFSQQNELLMSLLGFSSSKPEETNRTRVWCSARSQTLYKTISGLTNYNTAIKLLLYSENGEQCTPNLKLEEPLIEAVVNRKSRLLVAMQKYATFNEEQLKDTEILFQLFPHLKIAYVDMEPLEDGTTVYYSSLIGSNSEIVNGRREPIFRIRVSGNPILGDGKSDNQNHALIYYRGEYIQLVDSNQDHYIEECLKIRNVLAEFEEFSLAKNPYDERDENQVAIVGAREYIFSENIGVLGDVAAGKEQTFGTLFARAMAKVGGKLHYGHPDFLNAIFMTTRGGVSKAQKGLHLNEDIYAGMMALCRGGRIKHTEYIQCGKGRDLGFVSILNFTSKIGAGMGEQTLSREYFWLGTQLPFDRFMHFYYGHPGFHLNNVSIVTSIKIFLTLLLWLGTIASTVPKCKLPLVTGQLRLPPGCTNTLPLKEWLSRRVGSIATVFLIAQLPLFIQELSEKGLTKSLMRIAKHYLSLSMLFEIFVCQVYASAFSIDLSIGGAKYRSTGRGFATSRTPFSLLYEDYAGNCVQFGLETLVVLVYVSAVFWQPALLWFWLTGAALSLSPVIFNPHQFNYSQFFLDYHKTLMWFSHGGWIKFVRDQRAKVTGLRQRTSASHRKPSLTTLMLTQVAYPLFSTAIKCLPYIYLCSQRVARYQKVPHSNPILTLLKLSGLSIGVNLVALLIGLVLTLATLCCKHPSRVPVVSSIAYSIALVLHIGVFNVFFLINDQKFVPTIVGILALASIERIVLKIFALLICRQHPDTLSNQVWWTGKWSQVGWQSWYTPVDEFICKLCECSYFSVDFLMVHFLIAVQLPILAVPRIDELHSIMLLWLSPSRSQPVPLRRAKQQRHAATKYLMTCLGVLAVLAVLLSIGAMLPKSSSAAVKKVFS